jgi:hypothetical protein
VSNYVLNRSNIKERILILLMWRACMEQSTH